ncbi:hypothetical protein GKA01_12760 [Gluconobacter kanchanaburiensis NBRC 103587]|uniref:Uncharacterized protein n=1 Tax=Gluconobacter kanchanaburiensis NBRC 103587 TaxID=1307948 RepID=A0A511B6J1_9PROT|nr:hypothetical protein AA103587_1390 [Gluconobacter kanchanaburiensis NBRC 103587]GEK96079.1 hypothetical protein GKA01_12760 [Gluconobacter kanchanaburiensis NBRC 103587]
MLTADGHHTHPFCKDDTCGVTAPNENGTNSGKTRVVGFFEETIPVNCADRKQTLVTHS